MNDESKRRLAASLEKPLDPKKDRQLVDALEKDPQAKAWVAGLKTVDSALRRWPSPARSANEWEDFAARLEQRLGESPPSASSSRSDSFDPLAPPVLEGDDGDAQRVEQTSMGSPDKNDDDDLEALAALTRSSSAPTSLAPPPKAVGAGPSLHDDAMDESSGIVDMKQLAELALKQPVPPPAGALAPTPADTTGRSDAAVMAGEKPTAREAAVPASNAAAEAKSAKAAPVHAAPAKASEPEKKGGVSWVLWITPVIAAAAAGGFFFMKSNAEHAANTASRDTVEQREIAPATPTAAAPAAAPAQPTATPPAPPTVAMNGPEEQGAQPGGAAPTAEAAPAPTQAAPQQPEANSAPTIGAATGASANAGAVARNENANDDSDGNADHHTTRSARSTTVAAADTTAAEGSRRENDNDQGAANTRSGSRGSGSAATGAPAAAPPPQATTASTTTVAAAPAARTPTPAAAAAAPAGGSAGGARSMDELMATAVGGSHGGGGSTTAAASLGTGGSAPAATGDALPDRPSRAQVTATMTPLSPAVRACTQGQTGVATVAMVIRSDGTVQSASVSGPFSADANTCITGVVRRAHFTAFTRPSVPIVYPFSIQPPRPGAQ